MNPKLVVHVTRWRRICARRPPRPWGWLTANEGDARRQPPDRARSLTAPAPGLELAAASEIWQGRVPCLSAKGET